jgi:hypothetical protein
MINQRNSMNRSTVIFSELDIVKIREQSEKKESMLMMNEGLLAKTLLALTQN